jgi:hypothetical protein
MPDLTWWLSMAGFGLFAWTCRAAYYRSSRGRWIWGRLPRRGIVGAIPTWDGPVLAATIDEAIDLLEGQENPGEGPTMDEVVRAHGLLVGAVRGEPIPDRVLDAFPERVDRAWLRDNLKALTDDSERES